MAGPLNPEPWRVHGPRNDPNPLPAPRRDPASWRAAVLAYRRQLRATREDRLAWPAVYAAFREVLLETAHAIAYAAANHCKWFWRGVYG